MSVKVMSAIWEIPMPPTDKLVLLALADCADEEGRCWPSIATIARKSGVSERSVQRAIRKAEDAKLIQRQEVIGKGCKYRIDPRHSVTPDKVAPVTNETPTPDTVSPKPSRTIISSEAKASSDKPARKIDPFPCPDGVDAMDWSSLIANRKAKRAALTPGAHRQIVTKLTKWSDAGWPPGPIVAHAAELGWTSVFPTDEMKAESNGRHPLGRHQPANGISATVSAAIDVFGLPEARDEGRVPQRADQVPRLGGSVGHG